jgi:steroid delta-isomerase-like uncharacterized protein
MSAAEHAFAHRWFEEVWNQGSRESLEELLAPDVRSFGFPHPEAVLDRDGFIAAVAGFHSTFSAIHVTLNDVIAEHNKLAAHWSATMTHTGDGLGFPATNAPVTLSGISIAHLRDGQITQGWNALDMTAVTQRLATLAASAV